MQSTRKSYYWTVFKKHWKVISVLTLLMVTLPIYIFTSLPPIEIIEEVPKENITEIPKNETVEIILSRNISLNITQGGSVFLEKQAPPPLIDSDIVIALDTSGSMDGDRLATAKAAINNLIDVLNKSQQTQSTKDRVGLISFSGDSDSVWDDNAYYETGLDYVSNQTHLNDLRNKTNFMESGTLGKTGVYTDIWSGLNSSLELLENSPRTDTALQSIILLTDGDPTRGPFYTDVASGNYAGFLSLPSNYSSYVTTPYSESPVAVARSRGIKIHTIGLYDGGGTDFDPNFLLNISKNPDLGTFGEYFIGDDNLTITDSFLKARDSASGWVQLLSNETNIIGNGSSKLYSFNVTENHRRLKWDLNWENTSVNINAFLTDPNGTIIDLSGDIPDNMIQISKKNPYSLIIDFPTNGLWQFNISWTNINSTERILHRLSSYQPPIFIDKVVQLNTTELNATMETNYISFEMNVTNKNPLFSLHNITPIFQANFSQFNYSYNWNPSIVPEIPLNSSTTFILNISFQEGVQIDGNFLMLVNSSEGYYDAYSQPLSLDFRTFTTNTTVETYTETQTVVSTVLSTSIGYTYDRQVLDQLNWAGLVLTFLLLFVITSLYIRSKEAKIRKLASQLRNSLLRNRSQIEAGLADVGVDVSQLSMDQLLSSISSLDELGTAIGAQTGTNLSTEDLIKVASGVSTSKVASRLSNRTGESLNNILELIGDASSIDEVSQKLNLSYDDFMLIISRDEQVDSFQSYMKSLVTPLGVPASSRMFVQDDVNLSDFRTKLKRRQKNK